MGCLSAGGSSECSALVKLRAIAPFFPESNSCTSPASPADPSAPHCQSFSVLTFPAANSTISRTPLVSVSGPSVLFFSAFRT